MASTDEMKRYKAKNLRYRRSILDGYGYEQIQEEMQEIGEECDNVRYFFENGDDTLLNALDGEEDEAFEFKMTFSDLSAKCEELNEILYNETVSENFNDFWAASAGGCGKKMLGFDSYEEDWYALTGYSCDYAKEEANKRMQRLTKDELIKTAGVCFGVMTAFLHIRTLYDSLKAAFDILRNENTTFLEIIKEIEVAYNDAAAVGFDEFNRAGRNFDKLVSVLPDRTWIE